MALLRAKQVANGDLYKVYCHIRSLLQHQLHEYQAKSATEVTRLNHHLNKPFYAPLIGRVSVFALNKIANELARSREPDFPRNCTGTYTKTMGLPCAHELHRRYQLQQPVYLSLVHQHWHLLPTSQAARPTLQQPQLLNPTPTTVASDDDDVDAASVSATSHVGVGDHGLADALPDDPRDSSEDDDVVLLEPLVPRTTRQTRTTRRDPSVFETVGARVRRRRARNQAHDGTT